jgi:hypothetical protein
MIAQWHTLCPSAECGFHAQSKNCLADRWALRKKKETRFRSLAGSQITPGSFCRRLELPAEVNPKTFDAIYKKGVLKLVFQKTKAF